MTRGILIMIMMLTISSCGLFQKKIVYVNTPPKIIYPTLPTPISMNMEVGNKTVDLYAPKSDYVRFMDSNSSIIFKMNMYTYGLRMLDVDDKTVNIIMVDSAQYYELVLIYNVLLSNHIRNNEFLKIYKDRYDEIERNKNKQ